MNLYINLYVYAKKLINFIKKHFDNLYLNEKKKVFDFYLKITNKTKFNEINKFYFIQIFEKLMREKIKRKFKLNILINNNSNFILFVLSFIKKTFIKNVVIF